MNQTTKRNLIIGGVILGVAALYKPGMRLYRMLKARMNNKPQEEETPMPFFAPSYLGKHKPHHRKAKVDGHAHHQQAEHN